MTRPLKLRVTSSVGARREIAVRDLAIRFAFGATVSATAAIISLGAGVRIGGLFLAFPAILPATLTLIEKENSKRAAEKDDVGAVLGACALAGFAGLAWCLIPVIGAAGALSAALAGWLLVAVSLYIALQWLRSRR